jgi:hypothetical protein
MGLNLDHVELRGVDLSVETEPFAASIGRPGELEVTLMESSLAAFLEKEAPGGLRDFAVSARDGKLYVQASKRVLIDIRATAVCTLRIDGGKRLFVDLESAEASGLDLRNMLEAQLANVNPVLDASDLPLRATLTDVNVGEGRVVLHGLLEP